jgi:hypothetical protein
MPQLYAAHITGIKPNVVWRVGFKGALLAKPGNLIILQNERGEICQGAESREEKRFHDLIRKASSRQ